MSIKSNIEYLKENKVKINTHDFLMTISLLTQPIRGTLLCILVFPLYIYSGGIISWIFHVDEYMQAIGYDFTFAISILIYLIKK